MARRKGEVVGNDAGLSAVRRELILSAKRFHLKPFLQNEAGWKGLFWDLAEACAAGAEGDWSTWA